MSPAPDPWLLAAAALSALAALLHVGCIVFGAAWYRFFGAGERMARLAEAGDRRPAVVTSGIVLVLAVWSAYALSGAGAIRPLPRLPAALCAITAVYLLRGVAGLVYAAFTTTRGRADLAFWWWSSAICLTFGFVHLTGLWRVWGRL